MAQRVITTRPKSPYPGDRRFAERLVREGFEPLSLTTVTIEPREISPADAATIASFVTSPDLWIAFLSPTAVHVFGDIARKHGWDVQRPSIRIAVQGAGTRESVREVFSREVDLESTVATAEVFAQHVSDRLEGTGKVLVPQSAEGRDVFGPIVNAQGNQVVCISTYGLVSIKPSDEEIARVHECSPAESCVVFMSPSSVRATIEGYPYRDHLRSLRVVSIGPSTSKAIREVGLKIACEAQEHTEGGVVNCVKGVFSR